MRTSKIFKSTENNGNKFVLLPHLKNVSCIFFFIKNIKNYKNTCCTHDEIKNKAILAPKNHSCNSKSPVRGVSSSHIHKISALLVQKKKKRDHKCAGVVLLLVCQMFFVLVVRVLLFVAVQCACSTQSTIITSSTSSTSSSPS